ncbi:MAG: hypothetical protein ACLPY2_01665 [Bryobacteraceae bacterium]
MAYDEKLCLEKHKNVDCKIGRVWWFLSFVSLAVIISIGYACANAAQANTRAAVLEQRMDGYEKSTSDAIQKILHILQSKQP